MKLNRFLPANIFIFIIVLSISSNAQNWINFNSGWKFTKGNPINAELIKFDDSTWETVDVPHDWAISGPFDIEAEGNTGKLPWKGEGWYRKSFKIDKKEEGKVVYFMFDGIMAFPKIYINGKLAGQWDYGYNSFYLDVTKLIQFGKENLIAVYVDTRQHGSRWYPGAGIYRKVQMKVVNPVHVDIWGTYITTPTVTNTYADVRIQTTINNLRITDKKVNVESILISPEGKDIQKLDSTRTIKAGKSDLFEQWATVIRPTLWDVENPVLYTLKTVVKVNGQVVDVKLTPYGYRSCEFTANDGFLLNGKRLQLKGVNLHHDHGPLGVAFNTRAMERQLEIMRSLGVNAIRTSHNVCAPELLELCDQMGFVVYNEAFDKWDDKADILSETDFYEFGHRNLKNFVLRDRNHPSVIIWSVGNEMHDIQLNENNGLNKLQSMVGYVREFDPTRPITMASDLANSNVWRHFDYYDVHSWNYGQRWEPSRKSDPTKAVIISESASTLSTRGFYELPLPDEPTDFTESSQVSSYDLNAPAWAEVCDDDFMWQEEGKYIVGEFVWTGFDYLGEPTPYPTSRSSYFGIVDLCGIPKDRFYLYKSYWKPEETTIHILPHWNWRDDFKGKKVPVFVYTNGDGAELFLNGKSLGMKYKNPKSNVSTERYRLMWNDVVYEPGELKVIVYKEGKVIGEAVKRTASEPYAIKLTPDRNSIKANCDDLCYILVEAYDKEGNLCPLADNLINFTIEGPAKIAGVGNGNPRSHEPFKANYRKLFNGKAMLIIRSKKDLPGKVEVKASSEDLNSDSVIIESK